jgi:hypothetical protein
MAIDVKTLDEQLARTDVSCDAEEDGCIDGHEVTPPRVKGEQGNRLDLGSLENRQRIREERQHLGGVAAIVQPSIGDCGSLGQLENGPERRDDITDCVRKSSVTLDERCTHGYGRNRSPSLVLGARHGLEDDVLDDPEKVNLEVGSDVGAELDGSRGVNVAVSQVTIRDVMDELRMAKRNVKSVRVDPGAIVGSKHQLAKKCLVGDVEIIGVVAFSIVTDVFADEKTQASGGKDATS